MPYKLRKARNRDLYWVVGIDGTKHSKEPIPKKRAEAQMKALYIAMRTEKKGGVSIPNAEFVKEHKELLEVLKHPTKASLSKEYSKQKKELVKFLNTILLKGGANSPQREKYEKMLKEDAESWDNVVSLVLTVTDKIAWLIMVLGPEFPFFEVMSLFIKYVVSLIQEGFDLYKGFKSIIRTIEEIEILKEGTKEDKDIAAVLIAGLPAKFITVITGMMKLGNITSSEFIQYANTPSKNIDSITGIVRTPPPDKGAAPDPFKPITDSTAMGVIKTFADVKGIYGIIKPLLGVGLGVELPSFENLVSGIKINKTEYNYYEDSPEGIANAEWNRIWAEENTQYAVPSNRGADIVKTHILKEGILWNTYQDYSFPTYYYPSKSLHTQYWDLSPCCDFSGVGYIKDKVTKLGTTAGGQTVSYTVNVYDGIASPLGTDDANTFKKKWLSEYKDGLAEKNFRKGENYVKPSVLKRAEEDWELYNTHYDELMKLNKIGEYPTYLQMKDIAPSLSYKYPDPKSEITKEEFIKQYTAAWSQRDDFFNNALGWMDGLMSQLKADYNSVILPNYNPNAYTSEELRVFSVFFDVYHFNGVLINDYFDRDAVQKASNVWRDMFENQGDGANFAGYAPNWKYKGLLLCFLFPRAILAKKTYNENLTKANALDPTGNYLAPVAIDAEDLEFIFGGLRTAPIPAYAPRNPGNSLWGKATYDALIVLYRFIHRLDPRIPLPPKLGNIGEATRYITPDQTDRYIRDQRQQLFSIYLFVLDTNNLGDIEYYGLQSFMNTTDWKNSTLTNTPSLYPIKPTIPQDFLFYATQKWMEEVYWEEPYHSYNNAQRDAWISQECQRLFDAR